MQTSYPEELTAQGLAEQRKARMSAILDPELPGERDRKVEFALFPDQVEAVKRLRAIDAEFS